MTGWLPEGTPQWGGRPVARTVTEAGPRSRVVVTGTVTHVTVHRPHALRSAGGAVARGCTVDATVDDGTGAILVRWAGRDSVPGLLPGAALCVEGTACEVHGRLVVLNPLYRFEVTDPSSAPGT